MGGWLCCRPTFTPVVVHQPEAAGTQALRANLEVLADVGTATIVVQTLVGLCVGWREQTGCSRALHFPLETARTTLSLQNHFEDHSFLLFLIM